MNFEELENTYGIKTSFIKHEGPSIADPAGIFKMSVGFRDGNGSGLYFALNQYNKITEVGLSIDGKRSTCLYPQESTFALQKGETSGSK